MSEAPIRPGVDKPPARPPVALRRSVAALRAGESGETQRSIALALLANVVVAAAKLAAGLISGSVALLAEAGHSAADSVNELLLGLSLRRARRPADAQGAWPAPSRPCFAKHGRDFADCYLGTRDSGYLQGMTGTGSGDTSAFQCQP